MKFLNYGEKIRKIRTKKGITLIHVSKKLGYKNGSTLSLIERNKKDLPIKKLPILLEVLGVSFEELFFEEKLRESQRE